MKEDIWPPASDLLRKLGNTGKTEPNYELVDKLVSKYQEGDKDAAEELIKQLGPYLMKFFKIVRLGIVDLSDKDSRRFIALFTEDRETRTKLKSSASVKEEVLRTASMIQSMCIDIPSEDLVQELIAILLTLAQRYDKEIRKANFCGYIYNAFRFELFRKITEMTIDPITRYSSDNVSYSDLEYSEEAAHVYVDEPLTLIDEELNTSWIEGLTCNDMFGKLTPLQRVILKLYYVDGEGDTGIADILCMHRNTVRKQRMRAEEILRLAKDDPDAQKEKDN